MNKVINFNTAKPHQLLCNAIKFYRKKGYLRIDSYNPVTNQLSISLLYAPAVQTYGDSKKLKGETPCICRVNLTIKDDSSEAGCFNYPVFDNDADTTSRKEWKFKKTKNHVDLPEELNIIVGAKPTGYTEPYSGSTCPFYCTEAEALKMMLIYFEGITVDKFAHKSNERSKVNALNPRFGHAFERLIIDDTQFYQACQKSMLTAVGRYFNAYLGVQHGDVITGRVLKEKEGLGMAPIKTDIILTVNDKTATERSVRVSAKCPQTYSASKTVSILGVGPDSKSGFAEVASRGCSEEVRRAIYELNRTYGSKGKFKDLDSIEKNFGWSSAKANPVRSAIYHNYKALIKLALLGVGNPYSTDPESQVDVVVEYNLQTGHGCILTEKTIDAKLANMSLADCKECFPISYTSQNTIRVMMNTPAFMAIKA